MCSNVFESMENNNKDICQFSFVTSSISATPLLVLSQVCEFESVQIGSYAHHL